MRFELRRSLSLQFGLHVLKERLDEILVDSIWSINTNDRKQNLKYVYSTFSPLTPYLPLASSPF